MLNIVETYYPSLNKDHHGNPLITAFPLLTNETITQLMTNLVRFDPAERQHSPELRVQYAMRLLDFFLPLPNQADFCSRLWNQICYGYCKRNPLTRSSSTTFAHLMRSINKGNVAPSTDGEAADAMLCGMLIGTPGTGKTTSIRSLLRRLGPGLLHHKKHGELYQLLYVFVQAPRNGSVKVLTESVFAGLHKAALETGMPIPYSSRMPKTEPQLRDAVQLLAEKLNLGVLVLDELQHLFRGTGWADNEAMKYLTGVITRLGIPVLLVGTWECLGLMGLEMRLARRAIGTADAEYRRMENGEEWRIFIDALLQYQFTQRPVEMSEELAEIIYFHTQGIQDLAVKLIVISQIEAIMDETEELTVAFIDATAKRHFNVIAPITRMLRDGRTDTDPTLWDLEPADLDGYLKDFAAKSTSNLTRRQDRKSFNAAKKFNVVESVAKSLMATGGVSTDDAQTLAQSAVAAEPDLPAGDHVGKILTEISKLAPRPTKSKSVKQQQKVEQAIMAFEDQDLRKILYIATRKSTSCDSIAEAFDQAGHLCDLVADLPC